ncbi:MAG TPA: T9SS type A sorting domain-containing protein, partial [Ignavibacteriaceae bacterium]|nr:T9SS type A sorting domain-containing protein [Ignavibacteriaceae bacterium]
NRVRLDIFNILGENIMTLKNEDMSAGFHTVTFNAGNLPSGTYIYRIQTNSFTQTKKMLLIK